MALPVLPTFYYHDHFTEMLAFVERVYCPMLGGAHRDFIAAFCRLPQGAQCLYIRMANRRGLVFHRDTLAYAEIADPLALDGLVTAGFARAVTPDETPALLNLLPKAGLLDLARAAELPEVRAGWAKAKLAGHLAASLPPEALARHLNAGAYVARLRKAELDYLLFLYFGKTFSDLKSFALRDLGIVGTNGRAEFTARFVDTAEAEACFAYAGALDRLDGAFEAVAESLPALPSPPTPWAAQLHARLAAKIGAEWERRRDADRAIACYRLAPGAEANERLVRLLHARGDKAEAEALLLGMLDDPDSDEEHVFAADFHARKYGGARVGRCTALLRAGQTIVLDELHRGAPEAGAVAHYRRHDWRPYHTESGVWHAAFGLMFWEELFGSAAEAHSDFDMFPKALADRSFAVKHAEAIAARLDVIQAGGALAIAATIISRWRDTPNGLFGWGWCDDAALIDLLTHAPGPSLAALLREMAHDFPAYRDGFPDLMLARDGAVRFVEIKAEGDQVRRNQLTRLLQLQRAGFEAGIARVAYRFDPGQDYVVVDIETTGGRPGAERITEIGAVRIRNHEIVDEWQSLVNPGRRIPAFITGLTGISDDMVRDAPKFGDIADEFADFMGDGIFVAHNVNFDYGFIAHEYGRLERAFRYPKFCTRAGMRRHFPGHGSYALAKLCEVYRIELATHHRALCDAQAAAGLLTLINRKREAIYAPSSFAVRR